MVRSILWLSLIAITINTSYSQQQTFQLYERTISPIVLAAISSCRNVCGDEYYNCKIGRCESKERTTDADTDELCYKSCTKNFRFCFETCAIDTDYMPTTQQPPYQVRKHTIDINSLIVLNAPTQQTFTGYFGQRPDRNAI